MISLMVNGDTRMVDIDPETPLLWVLRDHLGLTGTKYGCGIARCGACIVQVDGEPINSCTTPVSSVAGKSATTIEGLAEKLDHPVLLAWIQEDVPQFGGQFSERVHHRVFSRRTC